MPDVLTIAGSPAEPSRCGATLDWVRLELAGHGFDAAGFNVRDLPAEALLHGRADHPAIRERVAQVETARAVVIASPVYKAAYSGVLKSFLDLLPTGALAGKTVLPIATAGSIAHTLALDYALKPVLAALGARHVLGGVCLLDGDFTYRDGAVDQVEAATRQRLAAALDDLVAGLRRAPASLTAD